MYSKEVLFCKIIRVCLGLVAIALQALQFNAVGTFQKCIFVVSVSTSLDMLALMIILKIYTSDFT